MEKLTTYDVGSLPKNTLGRVLELLEYKDERGLHKLEEVAQKTVLDWRRAIRHAYREIIEDVYEEHLARSLTEQFGSIKSAAERIQLAERQLRRHNAFVTKQAEEGHLGISNLLAMLSSFDAIWQTQQGRLAAAEALRRALNWMGHQLGRDNECSMAEFEILHFAIHSEAWITPNLALQNAKSLEEARAAEKSLILAADAISAKLGKPIEVEELSQIVEKYGHTWCVLLYLIPFQGWLFDEETNDDEDTFDAHDL